MRNLLSHFGKLSASSVWHLPRKMIARAIVLYQRTFSPDHGPLSPLFPYGYCRHEPTCSAYAKKVFEERGVLIGGILTLRRVLSCNPLASLSKDKIMAISRKL